MNDIIMKYVILKDEINFLLFPRHMNHNLFVRKEDCLSAGFIHFDDYKEKYQINISCYGESTSLGLKSREDVDSALIKSIMKYQV